MLLFLWFLEIVVGILLILAVLLQVGRGETIASMFGGGVQSIFGPRGPTTVIEKITLGLIAAFFVITLAIAKLSITPAVVPQRIPTVPEAPLPEEILPTEPQQEQQAR